MQSLPEFWRKSLIRLHHVSEERISARRWPVQYIQEGSARRLLLKGHITVPGNCVRALFEKLATGAVVSTTEDEVNFWEALWCAGCLVDVVAAKVADIIDCFLDWEGSEVLITEGCRLLVTGH